MVRHHIREESRDETLASLLRERSFTRSLHSGVSHTIVEMTKLFLHPAIDEIKRERIYLDFGLFRHMLQEENVARIISAVRVGGEIASWAMLIQGSTYLSRLEGAPTLATPLGILGAYTRTPDERKGLATLAVARLLDHLAEIAPPLPRDEFYAIEGQSCIPTLMHKWSIERSVDIRRRFYIKHPKPTILLGAERGRRSNLEQASSSDTDT